MLARWCKLLELNNFNFSLVQDTWVGVLHHVCGEHSWASGRCKHEDQENTEGPNNYLNKDSKAMAALRKIVLDPKWLKTLHFYVRFR